MNAVFLDFGTVASDHLDLAPLEATVDSLRVYDHTLPEDVVARIVDSEVLVINKVRLDAATLAAAPKLRFIGLVATGTDNVDLQAAGKHGIAVTNIRAYCTASVVEHVFGVLLNLTRSIGRYERSVRRGDWQNARNFCMLDFPLKELSKMTLGIVGHGTLGKAVHRVASAFGMQVLVARRPGESHQDGDGRHSLEHVLERCDVISLHCPLTPATENLIGAPEFALMKPDALLINTARGGLVDSDALITALQEKRIGGAAIDVLRTEPPRDGDPLLDYADDRLMVTPHIAWATETARQNAVNEVAANIAAFRRGESRNRVETNSA